MGEKAISKSKVDVLYIEKIGMHGSGWIQDDTIGTANPIEISWPSQFIIPNTGFRKKETTDSKGKKTWINEPIRYIKDCPVISVAEQKSHGIEPSPVPSNDAIMIEKGFGVIPREGGTVGLYDYLNEVYYNGSNPDRVERATALYKVLKMDEKNEEEIEDTMIQAEATKFVGTLYEKKGKLYVYNENLIDGICNLLQVFSDSYSSKIKTLLTVARANPKIFMDKIQRWQQTTLTEVSHALEMGIIEFKENSVPYKTKDKLMCTLGNEKLSRDQKIEKLSDWLRTADGHEAYMELKAELEAAKAKILKN